MNKIEKAKKDDIFDIENQNYLKSLDMFDIVKEISQEYIQYLKKYKDYTSEYLEKISKLNFNQKKKELKNKNISPFLSIINKVPHLIEQQVKGLKEFITSFEQFPKIIGDLLENQNKCLENLKKSFEEESKEYNENKSLNEKLKSSFSSFAKKVIKYQLLPKTEKKDDYWDALNEAKKFELLSWEKNKELVNYHQLFQDKVIEIVDKVKFSINLILGTLNNSANSFLNSFNNKYYSPSIKYIQEEKDKYYEDPINTQKLIEDNLVIKFLKSEEFPSDKYNIQILDKIDLDTLYSKDVTNIKVDDQNNKTKNNDKNDDNNISKLSINDVLEIIKLLYSGFKMINTGKFDIAIEEEKIQFKNLLDKLMSIKITQDKNVELEEKANEEEKNTILFLVEKKI